MTLRVPTMKAKAVGMRKLSSPEVVGNALNTLKGRALRDKPGQGGRGRQGCAGGDELDIHSRSLLGIKGHTTPRVRPRAARGGCLAERRMV